MSNVRPTPCMHAVVLRSNNAGCDWDGGDCCGAKNFKFCNKCECLDCTYEAQGDDCVADFKNDCGAPKFKGDGYCDGQRDCMFWEASDQVLTHEFWVHLLPADANNVGGCDWDGGDCCGDKANIKYCKSVLLIGFWLV